MPKRKFDGHNTNLKARANPILCASPAASAVARENQGEVWVRLWLVSVLCRLCVAVSLGCEIRRSKGPLLVRFGSGVDATRQVSQPLPRADRRTQSPIHQNGKSKELRGGSTLTRNL